MNTLAPKERTAHFEKHFEAKNITEAAAVTQAEKRSMAHHEANLRMSAFQRLNLGPVGPECLKNPALKSMVDPTWTHVGGEPVKPALQKWAQRKLKWAQKLKQLFAGNRKQILSDKAIRERTHFEPFHYEIGMRFPKPSGKFSFIFSENYFQRFFMDEADAQFRECYRLLEEGGVLRIAVPDADLRTYDVPEPLNFQSNLKWSAREKHKTRWSIYNLAYALENAGFHVNPIAWTDKHGDYHFACPSSKQYAYKNTADSRFAFDLSYCANLDRSLVIDAIKMPEEECSLRGHLVSKIHPVR